MTRHQSARKIRNKKAMIGEQVNWTYVLIAGSVILLFFIGIFYQQKKAADKAYSENALKVIDTLTLQPPKSSQTVSFPKLDLKKTCTGGDVLLKIGTAQGIPPQHPTFSSAQVKSNEIMATTEEWAVPYKAANFVLLTSKDTTYIISHAADAASEKYAEEIYNALPEQANKQKIQEGTEPAAAKTRRLALIGINTNPQQYSWAASYKSSQATAIRITPDFTRKEQSEIGKLSSGYTETGQLSYCTKQASGYSCDSQLTYTGRAMLLGAIYSDDKAQYECTMEAAYKRLKQVTAIHEKRLELISQENLDDNCRKQKDEGAYGTDNLLRLKDTIGTAASTEDAYAAAKAVEEQNRKLLLESCPTIY